MKLTHPERIVDVETGVTKSDMARYVEAMAPHFLAFAAKRPLMPTESFPSRECRYSWRTPLER
jgi:DNA primase